MTSWQYDWNTNTVHCSQAQHWEYQYTVQQQQDYQVHTTTPTIQHSDQQYKNPQNVVKNEASVRYIIMKKNQLIIFLHFKDPIDGKEKERIQIRRERNRIAATKCREKKKQKLNVMLSKAETIQKSNNILRQEVYKLEAEKRQLVRLLMMKKEGSAGQGQVIQEDGSEFISATDQQDLYSVIDNMT